MRFIDAAEIQSRLTYERCIPAVRQAMIAFSAGDTRQVLRTVIPLDDGKVFGVMPGALGTGDVFGAKIVSVFRDAARAGHSHQGVVVLFDGANGAPVCVADGGAITAIRTAAASAVATDALSDNNATRLAILGTGVQARTHAHAIANVRRLERIAIWGRDRAKAALLAKRLASELNCSVKAVPTVKEAATDADIICTVTSAADPVLMSADVAPGTHINAVGSSTAGPVEIEPALVQRARFIADSREGVLAQGAEFLRAKAAGLVGDDHVAGEIGQVLMGAIPGRESREQVTIYKSLGHIAQDLAAARLLYEAPK